MTLIVGILCSDGAVIGADSASTSAAGNQKVMEYGPVRKIHAIQNTALAACTGSVGMSQRYKAVLDSVFNDPNHSRKTSNDIAKNISRRTIEDAQQTYQQQITIGSITAFVNENKGKKIHLVEFEYGSFQPEFKKIETPFVCMGNGQLYADPFLAFLAKVYWRDGLPTVAEGIFYTTWVIQHVIRVNTGGINAPIRISTISLDESKNVQINEYDELEGSLEEGKSTVAKVEEQMRQCFRPSSGNDESPSIPEFS